MLQCPNLKIKEYWEAKNWDTEKLKELIGVPKIEEILMLAIKRKGVQDVFIRKPSINKKSPIALAWEVIRTKGDQQPWMESVWHKLLPKKVSLFKWKTMFYYLRLDERVKKLGIPMASGCNCCVKKQMSPSIMY